MLVAAPAGAPSSSRKLGNGYSLALNTGAGTHLTLVYFHNCRRGYEQDLVKGMAAAYFQSANVTAIDLELRGAHCERSVLVGGDLLVRVVRDLEQLFASFDIDRGQVPHIDLRGAQPGSLRLSGVPTVGNFMH